MFLRNLLLCLLIHSNIQAFTVKSIVDGNWEDSSIWSNHLVPTNPDSIIVSHYIIINQDLIVPTNAILLIDSNGTICGDYQMKTICSDVYNYGHIYLNSLKISANFYNYKILQCKTSMILTACSATQSGSFHNIPPYGATSVWPPVLCKTSNTNWEGGNTGLIEIENNTLKIYPNPISDETVTIVAINHIRLKMFDISGKEVASAVFDNTTTINVNDLPHGIYFLELEVEGKKQVKKIFITD